MGVRSNIGNIATNAVQIASVGATTYSGLKRRALADATQALNNKKREEALAQKRKEKELNISTYSKPSTPEEAEELGRMKGELEAHSIRTRYAKMMGEEVESIDELVKRNPSPQMVEIGDAIGGFFSYLKNDKIKDIKEYKDVEDFMEGE